MCILQLVREWLLGKFAHKEGASPNTSFLTLAGWFGWPQFAGKTPTCVQKFNIYSLSCSVTWKNAKKLKSVLLFGLCHTCMLLLSIYRQVDVFHGSYRWPWSNHKDVFSAASSLQAISPGNCNQLPNSWGMHIFHSDWRLLDVFYGIPYCNFVGFPTVHYSL